MAGVCVLVLVQSCGADPIWVPEWDASALGESIQLRKSTVAACAPRPDWAWGESVPASALTPKAFGEAVTAGRFVGTNLPPTSQELPGYAAGPGAWRRDDLAVGDPDAASVGAPNTRPGRVVVLDGDPDAAPGSVLRASIEGLGGPVARLGAALVAADLNPAEAPSDDLARDELIIGAPGATCQSDVFGVTGAVYVCSFEIGEAACCVELCAPDGQDGAFGSALATGDFDGDGDVDLAVGAPKASNDGAVYVFDVQWSNQSTCEGLESHGAGFALQAALLPPQPIVPQPMGPGPLPGAGFGAALAAGPTSADPADFPAVHRLVVGAPDARTSDGRLMGAVVSFGPLADLLAPGGFRPLEAVSAPMRASSPLAGEATCFTFPRPGDPSDRFGAALDVADVDHDGAWEVAIGAPAAVGIGGFKSGAVVVRSLSQDDGWCVSGNEAAVLLQDWDGYPAPFGPGAELQFGASVRFGNFDGAALDRRFVDLAVSAPLAADPMTAAPQAGQVMIFYGGETLYEPGHGRILLHDKHATVQAPDLRATYDTHALHQFGVSLQQRHFGAALAVAQPRDSDFDALVVGEPGRLQPAGPGSGVVHRTRAAPTEQGLMYDSPVGGGSSVPFGAWNGVYAHEWVEPGTGIPRRWVVLAFEDALSERFAQLPNGQLDPGRADEDGLVHLTFRGEPRPVWIDQSNGDPFSYRQPYRHCDDPDDLDGDGELLDEECWFVLPHLDLSVRKRDGPAANLPWASATSQDVYIASSALDGGDFFTHDPQVAMGLECPDCDYVGLARLTAWGGETPGLQGSASLRLRLDFYEMFRAVAAGSSTNAVGVWMMPSSGGPPYPYGNGEITFDRVDPANPPPWAEPHLASFACE